jgi:hypothetical protein
MSDPTDAYLAIGTIGFVVFIGIYGVCVLYNRVCRPRLRENIEYDEIV